MKLPSEISKELHENIKKYEKSCTMQAQIYSLINHTSIPRNTKISTDGLYLLEIPDSYRGYMGVLFAAKFVSICAYIDMRLIPLDFCISIRIANNPILIFFIPNNENLIMSIIDFVDRNYLVSYQELSDFIDAQTIMHSI